MNRLFRFLIHAAIPCAALLLSTAGPAAAEQPAPEVAPQYQHINDNYKHPNVKVWVKRFEGEGREVYDYRNELVDAIGLRPGQDVADVGAGTGLFEPLLAHHVGNGGIVYAIDIAPEFIAYIKKQAAQAGLTNIRTVLSDQRSIHLPENSVDVVYICDAYHHFLYYREMLRSIHKALRPGGQLFLVEYDKRPGISPDWLMHHIRASKKEFSSEIEAGGFKLVEDIKIQGLKQTFVRRFIRK